MNKKKYLMILLVLLCCVLAMTGCGEDEKPISAETTYKITVADALGTPYTTGVVVRFMKDGTQAAMQVVNENGVAEKTLATGTYTVELTFTGDAKDYFYDAAGLTVTADQPELTVTLVHQTGESVSLFADSKENTAYRVNVGSTYVKLGQGRNYFLFTPTTAGTYQFSVTDNTTKIGYYGAPHFVQSMSAAEVVDNSFTLSISASMIGTNNTGTTVIVVGVDAGENDHCILNIVRTGDPERTLEDEPWMIYVPKKEPSAYQLPAGAVLADFDLTANAKDYQIIYNEADGFYHLNSADGPLVLVRLGTDTKYLACFKTILENSGVVKYFFDENGTFVKKESYSECLLKYIANMDENSGVYPLTEDLKYIIQQRGEYSGWFDPQSSLYLFKDVNGTVIPGINQEVSWLFMCCYIAK